MRWQDMQPDDLGRKFQCLVILGNSHHSLLAQLRTRQEWEVRRLFQFIRADGEGVLGAVADARFKDDSTNDKLFEHVAGKNGHPDRDYALIFFYRDYYHDQVLLGILGTTSAATRSAAWFMSDSDRVADLMNYLQTEKGISIDARSRGVDVLLEIKLRDGRHKTIKPIDAAAYAP